MLFERLSGRAEDAGRRSDATLRPVLQGPSRARASCTTRCCRCREGGRRRSHRRVPEERSEDYPGRRRRRAVASGCTRTRRWRRHVVGYMGAITQETMDRLPQPGLQAQRARRPVRRRAAAWSASCTAVGQQRLRGRRRRQHRARTDRPERRADRRLRHPAHDRPRHAAVRRAGAARPSCVNGATCPTDLAQHDSAPHNPLRHEDQLRDRVYRRHPTAQLDYPEWVQHKAPAGSVVVDEPRERPDDGDGQLPDVRQPLDREPASRRRSSRSCSPARTPTARRSTPTSRSSSTAPSRAATTSARRSSRSSPGRRCTPA